MGNAQVLNSAGVNDTTETMTSSGPTTGRVIDLFVTQEQISGIVQNTAQISLNTTQVSIMQAGAPESMDTFAEVADQLDVQDFLDALDGV
ncbi:MAG: hypothetical protein CL532_00860 [Aestuariivita sp.]|nr:hypothetical protein [Aestuariivita sp.]